MKKQRWEESENRREEERGSEKDKKSEEEEEEENAGARNDSNVAKHYVLGLREGRKVGSLKRRVRSHLARWNVARSTCQS